MHCLDSDKFPMFSVGCTYEFCRNLIPFGLKSRKHVDLLLLPYSCCITLHLKANLDRQLKPELNRIAILSVGEKIDLPSSINTVRLLLLSIPYPITCPVWLCDEPKLNLPLLCSTAYFSILQTVVT